MQQLSEATDDKKARPATTTTSADMPCFPAFLWMTIRNQFGAIITFVYYYYYR